MPEYDITDPHDPRLAPYRGLTDRAYRESMEAPHGLYIAESLKVIERAVSAGHVVSSVMTQRRWLAGVREIVHAPEVAIYVVPDAVAEDVTGYTIHRGALAAMQRPEPASVSDIIADANTILVLENITDHTNVGAVFRAAAALGADAVLVAANCGDPLYRRSVRVSMGGVFQVPWTRCGLVSTIAPQLAAEGIELVALALSDDAVSLDAYAASRPERVALALGAEGDGLSADALAAADRHVMIPMRDGVDSLNVASAGAVALWEITRAQRG